MARLCNITDGSDLRNFYLKLLSPFRISSEEALGDFDASKKIEEIAKMEGITAPSLDPNVNGLDYPSDGGMEFYITDEKGSVKDSKILMNEPLPINRELRLLHVLVSWSNKQIQQYDTRLFSSLPEVFKSSFLGKRPQDPVPLYKCLEAFLQEEPLGPEDMWLVTIATLGKSFLIAVHFTLLYLEEVLYYIAVCLSFSMKIILVFNQSMHISKAFILSSY